jgi:uncharacterized protein (DUF1778 family)
MSKSRVRELALQGDRLFSKRQPLMTLWQTMAENFFPYRADFITQRSLGDEFASNLMTGRPVLAHRDLGNSLSSMLRPRGVAWFHARTGDEDINNDSTAKQWLDAKSDVMRRAMYDQHSGFIRATKQGDNDFVAFGQTVISVDPNKYLDGVLYRNWHLKDVAWCENSELVIDLIHRNWQLEARQLIKLFPDKVSSAVRKLAREEPGREVKCRHIIIPEDEYDLSVSKKGSRNRLPFTSIYIDIEHDTILEEVPAKRSNYVIPRWVTVAGSQYAYSPSTVVSLPDARLLQQMTLTMLEAGQKAVDPPLKATAEAIQGGVNYYAGGITWVDAQYDERAGAALEPLLDTSRMNLGWGDAREEKIEKMISEAFFLNVINLPEAQAQGDKMTAYETQERVKEYIRRALPLFEPMEVEYNGALCEQTWNVALDLGMFGSFQDMPDQLRGKEINWQFESPLQEANERVKATAFTDASQLLAQAAQLDPGVRFDFDVDTAFREALGAVSPANWVVPKEIANAKKAQEQQIQRAQQAAQAMAGAADVATKVGGAVEQMGTAAQSVQAAKGAQQGVAA